MSRSTTPLLAVLFALVCAGTAVADPATASALYTEGQTAYQAQNFALAASKFTAAYEQDPDPVYLFNAAQAFRFGNDCVLSSEYYKRFLEKVPNPPNADKIKGWADEMATCASHQVKEKPTHAPVVPVIVTPPTAPIVVEPQVNKRKVAAIVSGGLGLAALGVALYYTYDSVGARDDEAAVCRPGCIWESNFESLKAVQKARGERDNKRAKIGFAASGVALAASLGLYLWSRTGNETEHQLAITPTTGGAMVVGDFRF